MIWSQLNIWNKEHQKQLIQTIRNFYGEKYGFFFLFKWYFNLWLIFPVILGLTFYNFMILGNPITINRKIVDKFVVQYRDLVYFTYCFLMVLWGIMFMKFWKQKEKLYAYFWGMEGAFSREKFRDEFDPEGEENIILEFKSPYQSQFKKGLKILASCLLTVFIVKLI